MKLSEKGYEKMFAWSGDPKGITFDQSDFEGVVVLTLTEAKALSNTLFEMIDLARDGFGTIDNQFYSERDLWKSFNNKIEQAEGKQ